MTPTDAARLLELPANATPAQIEARFREVRPVLEEKIAKALTPGLQQKYQAALAEITTAFETLVLAADTASVPGLSHVSSVPAPAASSSPKLPPLPPMPSATASSAPRLPPMPGSTGSSAALPPLPVSGPMPPAQPPAPAPTKKSGGPGLLIGVIAAVIVLGAGGWFALKIKAENAEKARLEAEARAQAELARQKAEAEEKARIAALEKAERERQDKLLAALRARVAELHAAFDSVMRSRLSAEADLSDLKARHGALLAEGKNDSAPDVRALAARIKAQEGFVAWLNSTIPNHPAKAVRSKVEAALLTRAVEAVTAAAEAYAVSVRQLQADLAAAKAEAMVTGTLALEANSAGVAWRVTDAFGVTQAGETPATILDVALGQARVVFSRPPWPDFVKTVEVTRGGTSPVRAEFLPAILTLEVTPATATVAIEGVTREADGTWRLAPGEYSVQLDGPDLAPQTLVIRAQAGASMREKVALKQDYTLALLRAALQRYSKIADDDKFLTSATGLAAALKETGDLASYQALAASVVARPLPRLAGVSGFSFPTIAMAGITLGDKKSARAIYDQWSRLLDGGQIAFEQWINRGTFRASQVSVLSALGETAEADRLIEQNIAAEMRGEHKSLGENYHRRSAYGSVIMHLLMSGFIPEARAWQAKFAKVPVDPDGFNTAFGQDFEMPEAELALKRRRLPEALDALRRETAKTVKIYADAKQGIPRHVVTSDFMRLASIARVTGYEEAIAPLARMLRETEAAYKFVPMETKGMPEDSLKYWAEVDRVLPILLDSVKYQAEAARLAGEKGRLYQAAAAIAQPEDAVKELLTLWQKFRLFPASLPVAPSAPAASVPPPPDLPAQPELTPDQQVIQEFWKKAAGVWKQQGQNSVLSTNFRMRVGAGDNFVLQRQTMQEAKFEFAGVDQGTGTIKLIHKNRSIGTIGLKNDVLQYNGVNGFGKTVLLTYRRVADSEW